MATSNPADFKVKNGLVVSTTATILSTENSVSTTTGALIVAGGATVGRDLLVSGLIYGTLASAGEATTSTYISGGTAGQVPYQTGPGITGFFGPGTAGNVLVSNGTDAPSYQDELHLSGTTPTYSTLTGALTVTGGVGIGGSLYVQNYITATNFTILGNRVALGISAGETSQGLYATAIGSYAGQSDQGGSSLAAGTNAGQYNQGQFAVALGYDAGQGSQGDYAVAIGAYAAASTQPARSIVINATGVNLNVANTGTYISPLRADASSSSTRWTIYYNPATKELTTSSSTPIVGSATPTTEGIVFGYTTSSAVRSTFIGYCAGNITSTGCNNIGAGGGSLSSNTSGCFNNAIGFYALHFNTTGNYNTAFGSGALQSNTEGTANIGIGASALVSNTCGNNNVAIGNSSLRSNILGEDNTAIGSCSLQQNTSGSNNTAIGLSALSNTKTGGGNTAIGKDSLNSNCTGNFNTAIGQNSLYSVCAGSCNTVIGYNAGSCLSGSGNVILGGYNGCDITTNDGALVLVSGAPGCIRMMFTNTGAMSVGNSVNNFGTLGQVLTSAGPGSAPTWSSASSGAATPTTQGTVFGHTTSSVYHNVSLGYCAGNLTSTGCDNIALGYAALTSNTSGNCNIALGMCALKNNTEGVGNVAIGNSALAGNTTGQSNIAIGPNSLNCSTTGDLNYAIGSLALWATTTGACNMAFGNGALQGNTVGSHNIAIGHFSQYYSCCGTANIGIGACSLNNNISGSGNVALGQSALLCNDSGNSNVAIGNGALACATNSSNLAIGYQAGCSITTGYGNVVIGTNNGYDIATKCGHVIIADGIGNIKASFSGTGALSFGSSITSFGTPGQVLTSLGLASSPVWASVGAVSTASNLDGGTAGQIPYQSLPGVTGFISTGAVDTVLVSNGTSAPSFRNTLTLAELVTPIVRSAAGGTKVQLSDIGILSIIVNGGETKFLANGVEVPGAVYSGSYGGARIDFNDDTRVQSLRYDAVKIETGTAGTAVNTWSFAGSTLTTPGKVVVSSTLSSTSSYSANALFVEGGIAGNSGFNINGNGYLNGDLFVNGIITGTNVSLSTLIANSGTFYGDSTGNGALYAGIAGYTPFAQTMIQASGNYNNYMEINVQNINPGAQASTDIVASADNVTDSSAYIDMGITSSGWDGSQPYSLGTALGPNDGYVMVGRNAANDVGDLVLGTTTTGTEIKFVVGAGSDVVTEDDISVAMHTARTASSSTNTGALVVVGGMGVSGKAYFGDIVTAPSFVGNLTGVATTASYALSATTASFATTASYALSATTASFATTATNLTGGSAGSIPYQASTGTTSMLEIGLLDQILISDGTSAYWGYLGALSGDTSVNAITSGTALLSIADTGVISLPVTGSLYDNVVASTSTTAGQVIDSFAIADYRTVKYLIQAVCGTDVHSTEVTLMHNDVALFLSQYNTMYSASALMTVTGNLNTSTSIVELSVTPTSADTTIDFIRTGLFARPLGSGAGLEGDLMSQSGSEDLMSGSGTLDLNGDPGVEGDLSTQTGTEDLSTATGIVDLNT